MINSAQQNQIVRFEKPDNPVFFRQNRTEHKMLGFQDLTDISPPPLSLSTKKCLGGVLEVSLIIIIFAFFNILRICQRRGVNRRRVR
jgi:hypothetical protein